MIILPFEQLVQCELCAFAKTDDGPEGAAERAAAADAAAKEPLDVDGQGFLQHSIDPAHRRLELLGSHSGQQTAGELRIEAVAQAKYRHVARAANDDGLLDGRHRLVLEVLQIVQLLILVDGVKVGEGHGFVCCWLCVI